MVKVIIKPNDRAFRAAVRTIKRIRSKGYRNQTVRPAVNATASVLNKAMKAKARTVGKIEVITGRARREIPAAQLARSIGIRRKTYARTGWVIASVGPRFSYTAPGGVQPSAFAIFVEGLEKSKALKSAPKPFARPAVNQSMQKMRTTFRNKLVERTERVVAKLRARGSTV